MGRRNFKGYRRGRKHQGHAPAFTSCSGPETGYCYSSARLNVPGETVLIWSVKSVPANR